MWHTPSGDRTLRGSEAALIRVAVTRVAEMIREEAAEMDAQWEYDIALFDSLPWSQRLALLDRVATHLLHDTPRSIELSAVNEATVGALFEHIKAELEWEIDTPEPPGTFWRQLVLAAYLETVADAAECDDEEYQFQPPAVDSTDHEQWHELVEILADGILWDRDYEMEDSFLDADPEKAEAVRSFMGIDDDYFAAAPPDLVSDAQATRIFDRLVALGRPGADQTGRTN